MADIQESNYDPVVLYIVVRKELKMSAGKVGAQIGHAVQKLLLRYFKDQVLSKSKQLAELRLIGEKELSRVEVLTKWCDSASTKVVLGATDAEFSSLVEEMGKDIFLVKDAGKTQVEAGTSTVLCLWPQKKSEVSESIRRLPLYR
jgi:PTH2 family peptidyl-tRNA hydrolase